MLKTKLLLLTLFIVQLCFGQSIWTNSITDTNPSANNPYTNGDITNSNITVSGISRSTSITAEATPGTYSARGWNTASLDTDKYFEFTLTANSGFKINLESLVFYCTADVIEPQTGFAIRSSIDGFSTSTTCYEGANTIDLSGSGFQNITGSVTFRIYAWGTTDYFALFGINSFTFNGSVIANTVLSPVIWSNDITASNPSASNPYTTNDVKNANLTVSGISRSAGINAIATSGRYDAIGWNSPSFDANDYYEFTLTPLSGYKINFESFEFDCSIDEIGYPLNYELRSSIDNYGSAVGTVNTGTNSIDLTGTAYQDLTGPITFRIYAWDGSTYYGQFGVNSFAFHGSVEAAAPTTGVTIWSNPIINTNPSASNPFTTGDVKDANITVSGISRGTGIIARSTANRYDATGWENSFNTDDYFEFTLTPNSGYAINLESFIFDGQTAGATAPHQFALRSSADGYTSNIGVVYEDGNVISLTGSAYQNLSSSITFRLYAWGVSDANGRYGINSFEFKGSIEVYIPTASVSIWSNPIIDTNPSNSNPFTSGDVKDANLYVSGIGRSSGIIERSTYNRYDAKGWNSPSFDENKYFSFTLTPSAGYKINLSNIKFDGQTAGVTAPNQFALRSSVDNFSSNIGTVYEDGNSISLSSAEYQNLTSAVTFRLYAWGASSEEGRYGINSFEFTGSVVSAGASSAAYFRSKTSGNWSALSSWETSADNNTWNDASELPNLSTTSVTVLNGHEITVNTSTSTTQVNVNAGAKLTIASGVTLTASSFNLLSNATGTGTLLNNGALTSATSTVQQYLTGSRNWYIGSPVSGATVPNGSSYYKYDEVNSNWASVAQGTALTKGFGYIAPTTGTTTLNYSGTLNNGDIQVSITRVGATKTGFNLIANPYPSYLNWNSFITDAANSHILTTFWYRTKNNSNAYVFSTYNNGVIVSNDANTTITGKIPPMQAFWVRVNEGSTAARLTFKNSIREHQTESGNTQKVKAQALPMVRLVVSNGINSDETVIYTRSNATNELDGYDSPKMSNDNALITEIFTLVNGEHLTINAMNQFPINTAIPLGLSCLKVQDISIRTSQVTLTDDNMRLILLDTKLNVETHITQGASYTFTAEANANNINRFALIFRSNTSTGINNAKTKIDITRISDNEIRIGVDEESDVKICGLNGIQMYNQRIIGNKTIKLPSGVYVISVSNNKTAVNRKVSLTY